MSLNTLISSRKVAEVTPVTSGLPRGNQEKPNEINAVTTVTPVTPILLVTPSKTEKIKGWLYSVEVVMHIPSGTILRSGVLLLTDIGDYIDMEPEVFVQHWGKILSDSQKQLLENTVTDITKEVTCGDCRHFVRQATHNHLGRCSGGEQTALAGNWDTDKRACPSHNYPPIGRGQS